MKILTSKLLALTFLLSLGAPYPFNGVTKAQASWEAEWEKTVAAAKKEGQVTIYTSSNQNNMLLESGAFQKRLPEIKVIMTFGGRKILPRIMAERGAGENLADIAFTGPSTVWELYLASACSKTLTMGRMSTRPAVSSSR